MESTKDYYVSFLRAKLSRCKKIHSNLEKNINELMKHPKTKGKDGMTNKKKVSLLRHKQLIQTGEIAKLKAMINYVIFFNRTARMRKKNLKNREKIQGDILPY